MLNDFLPLKKQGAIPEQSQANCRRIISENDFYVNCDFLPSEKPMGVPKEIECIVLKNCFDVNSHSNALRWNVYNFSFQYIGIPTETVGTSKLFEGAKF